MFRNLLIADSGKGNVEDMVRMLRDNYPPITDLRTAVIWTKGGSTFKPDYSIEDLPTNPWIHQPFEEYDGLRPDVLQQRMG